MVSLFFSYSHRDEEFRDELEIHLAMLKREGSISAWHDRRIDAGAKLHDDISEHLETANIILLLVSPSFLASDYCYEREMTRALERQKKTAWQSLFRLSFIPAIGRRPHFVIFVPHLPTANLSLSFLTSTTRISQ